MNTDTENSIMKSKKSHGKSSMTTIPEISIPQEPVIITPEPIALPIKKPRKPMSLEQINILRERLAKGREINSQLKAEQKKLSDAKAEAMILLRADRIKAREDKYKTLIGLDELDDSPGPPPPSAPPSAPASVAPVVPVIKKPRVKKPPKPVVIPEVVREVAPVIPVKKLNRILFY